MNNAIKDAIYDILKMEVERNNYGMLARHRPSNRSCLLLAENKIRFDKEFILQDGVPIYEIQPRMSHVNSGGMYKELLPNLISLHSDWPDVSPRGYSAER